MKSFLSIFLIVVISLMGVSTMYSCNTMKTFLDEHSDTFKNVIKDLIEDVITNIFNRILNKNRTIKYVDYDTIEEYVYCYMQRNGIDTKEKALELKETIVHEICEHIDEKEINYND